MRKIAIAVAILLTVFTLCMLAGLPVPLCIAITATVGVAVLEICHFPTVIAAATGVFALSAYYLFTDTEHLTHTIAHEGPGMLSLYALLIGGTLMAMYLIPATKLVPTISRALPNERFLPMAIYGLGLGVSFLNPVIGALFMVKLIQYEYRKLSPMLILGVVVTANAGAAMSPMSDVGSMLVANGIPMPATWTFVVPFVALSAMLVIFFDRTSITSDQSDRIKEKVDLKKTTIFTVIMFLTVLGQLATNYVLPGMALAIVYVVWAFRKKKNFTKEALKTAKNFIFLPLLVLIWALVQEHVPALFGEFTATKVYLLNEASTCFDNVALTVSVIKESLPWYFAVLGLCIGGSFLPFSSAASAAVHESATVHEAEKISVWTWFKAGIIFNLLYTVMWWSYYYISQ